MIFDVNRIQVRKPNPPSAKKSADPNNVHPLEALRIVKGRQHIDLDKSSLKIISIRTRVKVAVGIISKFLLTQQLKMLLIFFTLVRANMLHDDRV
jgi:hypothetical protein